MGELEVDHLDCGENGGKPEELEEPSEGVQSLCFSSTGDFVGFSGPVSGCSSEELIDSHALVSNPSLQKLEGPEPAACLLSPAAPDEETSEEQPDNLPKDVSGHQQNKGLCSTYSSNEAKDKMCEI